MLKLFKKEYEKTPRLRELTEYVKKIKANYSFVWSGNDLVGLDEFEDLRKGTPEEVKKLVHDLIDLRCALRYESKKYDEEERWKLIDKEPPLYGGSIVEYTMAAILKKKLDYTSDEWLKLIRAIHEAQSKTMKGRKLNFALTDFPIQWIVKQFEFLAKAEKVSPELENYVRNMLDWKEFKTPETNHYGPNFELLRQRLIKAIGAEDEVPMIRFYNSDIGPKLIDFYNAELKSNEAYGELFLLASQAKSSKPSKKTIKQTNELIDKIGADAYRKTAHQVLQMAIDQEITEETKEYDYGNHVSTYTTRVFLHAPHQAFIKGMVWTLERYSDKETLRILSKLFEKSYHKIPGVGAAAASVGNACAWVLGNMRGKDGLGALSRLKTKMTQSNIKDIIDNYLMEGAKKYGVSVEELKEMAIADYHLVNGEKKLAFEDYQLRVFIEDGKVQQQFIKPDGSVLKSVPSSIKNSTTLSKKLKDARKEIKEIQAVLSAQKIRIDNQFILNRTWDYPAFEKHYLHHGLVSAIAKKLIWRLEENGNTTDAIWVNDNWQSLSGDAITWTSNQTQVQLWHPIFDSENNVLKWRDKMMELQWKQPIKQAFREIYIVTDAEVNTVNYSNRMAAHILKQHQFNSLAKIRDWKYVLMGAFDNGFSDQTASKHLPEYNITAEYWINEMGGEEDHMTDAGMWKYAATDQVRFLNENQEPMRMVDVPKIVFSECMRDVDLFVGVCSVGNDPQWADNNREHREYWTSYSFGDLNELAKTRKTILENLLPRLKKLKDKAHIDGKFLIVKGSFKTYKIHIGSSNILMEPNDQYLCIVPSRDHKATNNLFIPFEGDNGLSIVLSKAFLLAEDEKITDDTITSQIHYKG